MSSTITASKVLDSSYCVEAQHYLNTILKKSDAYLSSFLAKNDYENFIQELRPLYSLENKKEVIEGFIQTYISFIKFLHQSNHKHNQFLCDFIYKPGAKKIIWGDCLDVLRGLKSESIHCMVTSPPYYNAREYSKWDNLKIYLDDMEKILKECYRVLDNHRVFVFNVGDIFDNDNLYTRSTWGKRRLPLGAYFIGLFEKVGFTFVDDIIWDKGEVQSERHKNGNRPYPFYQYPMNCYEHILVFHKHRDDKTRYPCPICGTLNVNGNAYSERGLKSWECKNLDCWERSKSNRGKRFSLKTLQTQSKEIRKSSEIENDLIYAWRRDIKKFNPVIKINSKGVNVLGHTAPFPKEIPEFAVKMFSYPKEYVLDPFSGLGTSVLVASQLGRIGIGIEKNTGIQKSVLHFLGNDLSTISFSNNFQVLENL